MGFKCPVCMKDFGHDKNKWENHISKAHDGVGDDINKIVVNSCSFKKDKDSTNKLK